MTDEGSDDITRRDVLRTAAGAGAVATAGLASTGTASATTVSAREQFDEDLQAIVDRETEDLREQLSDLGHLPDEDPDQFDLSNVDDAIEAASSATGAITTVKDAGASLVSISHNTAAANMAIFVKPEEGESHAVVEADGDRTLVTADGPVESENSQCYTRDYCDLGCSCEQEVSNPYRPPWVDKEYRHQEKGVMVFEECCVSGGGYRGSCHEIKTTPCNGCRDSWSSGPC